MPDVLMPRNSIYSNFTSIVLLIFLVIFSCTLFIPKLLFLLLQVSLDVRMILAFAFFANFSTSLRYVHMMLAFAFGTLSLCLYTYPIDLSFRLFTHFPCLCRYLNDLSFRFFRKFSISVDIQMMLAFTFVTNFSMSLWISDWPQYLPFFTNSSIYL